ncbi:hypothetical protein ACH5Y9_23340 [Methylomonas sp. BW4-1]|uniref:hypothetical protein n=1 Tax=unclassified Methylomonas TaxID=2608980 RepID=UPI00068A11F8|nr:MULTISPECIES: hypothetical protein [unclassified Methylomonas]QBC29352.1 hypothetical protein U737_21890 [Methylomonas sp. LW13]QSB00928.1 hypothetical protein JWZ98_20125 [Methylomonas sp. EFPC1]
MINTQLIKKFLTGLLFAASAAVSAQEYPAADFQPKVLYRDPAIAEVAKASSPVAATSNASAPCAEAKQEPTSEVDAKYPAASFQPKVVFSAAGS